MKRIPPLRSLGAISLLLLVAHPRAWAQITPDATLPSNSIAIPEGNTIRIEGGTAAGSNLFHSFEQFNVPTGREAFFNNALDIQNIISRVTGGSISQIDGLIGANGTANLFLINPNGIIFGPNARLNIGGSFIGAAASSLKFADGSLFSATNPQASPLLTVNVPVGLQFNTASNPGAIRVEGTGNSARFPTPNMGLSVAPGRTLALVGGEVTFTGGIVSAQSGRIEIGSVANGEVSLTATSGGWRLGYDQVGEFRDLQLLDRSSLWNPTINSNLESGIQVQGRRVIVERSQIATLNQGTASGNNIALNATQSLEIGGVTDSFPFSGWIVSQVDEGALEEGGSITVTTPQLTLQEGGRIQTLSFGAGAAGNITVNAESIQVSGFSPFSGDASRARENLNSRISSENLSQGAGGNISISSQQLTLLDGGQVETLVQPNATGNGGNVSVNANSITLAGANPFNPTLSSGIRSESLGAGNGGKIDVSTGQLTLSAGGVIESQVQGTGMGGDVTVNASGSILGTGINPYDPTSDSGIIAVTLGPANGGNISVSAPQLVLQAGATVTSGVLSPAAGVSLPGAGTGNAGNVTVNAEVVELIGVNPLLPINLSDLTSVTFGSGNGGNVSIFTRRLTLTDGAALGTTVSLASFTRRVPLPGAGSGKGGDVTVNATESLELSGANPFVATTPTNVGTVTFGSGNAGNVSINTPRLVVQNGGQINSATVASGNAGRITINAPESILVSGISPVNSSPAEISAAAFTPNENLQRILLLPPLVTGNTGEITLTTGRLTVQNGGRIGVQHQGVGNAGSLQIDAQSVLLQQEGSIRATTASGQGGNITLNVRDALQLRHNSQISATAGETGDGGNLAIQASTIAALENSDISANSQGARGGGITISATGIFGTAFRPNATPASDITATGGTPELIGTVEINTPDVAPSSGLIKLPANLTDISNQVAVGCSPSRGDRFVITGRSGLPSDPTQTLRGRSIWRDVRPVAGSTGTENFPITHSPSPIVEARGWTTNANGEIELVAIASSGTAASFWDRAATCQQR